MLKEIIKLGGGVLNQASDFENVISLIQQKIEQISENSSKEIVIIVSALDKTTSILEKIFTERRNILKEELEKLYTFHQNLINGLKFDKMDSIHATLANWYQRLISLLEKAAYMKAEHLLKYQALYLSEGEYIAKQIMYAYLKRYFQNVVQLEAKECIKTKQNFLNAKVDLIQTKKNVQEVFAKTDYKMLILEGFVGSNFQNEITTLGKEGSDYTAAIIAYCLEVSSVSLYKNVSGILSADPKMFPKFKESIQFDQLTYQDVEKISFWGANIIHGSVVELAKKYEMDVWIKPFYDLQAAGTLITKTKKDSSELQEKIVLLKKTNQVGMLFEIKKVMQRFQKTTHFLFFKLFSLFQRKHIIINYFRKLNLTSLWVYLDQQDYEEHQISLIKALQHSFRITQEKTSFSLITVLNDVRKTIPIYNLINQNERVVCIEKTLGVTRYVIE